MAVDPIRKTGGPQVRAAGVQAHALFERHSRMVYGLCRALLRDPDDADDATQATFVSAYQSLLAGNRVREPAAWLATIARNECAARSRSRMREPLPLPDADLVRVDGPEAQLERNAVVSELREAIAGLPPKQREAVVLRDLYGLPYTEVGVALGISLASVESLLFRARRSLRVSLKTVAGGALTVPVAVREGVAQALPALGAGGGGASGAVGIGLLAKMAGGPAALKAAAGVAAAVAAGSIAVAGVEHDGTARHRHPASTAAAHGASARPTHPALAAAAPVDTGAPSVARRQFGNDTTSGDSTGGSSNHSGSGHDGSGGNRGTEPVAQQGRGGEGSGDGGVAAVAAVKHDAGDGAQESAPSSGPFAAKTGAESPTGGHGGDGASHSGPGGGGLEQSSGESSGSAGSSGHDSANQVESDSSGSSGSSGSPGSSGSSSDSGDGGHGDSAGTTPDESGGHDSHGGHGGDVPTTPA